MKYPILIALSISFSITTTAFADQSQFKKPSKNITQHKVEKVFVFSPRTKYWAAYENGHKIRSGVANGGKPGYQTPAGTFRVIDKKGPTYLSTRYPINPDGTRGGAMMPYAMHFTRAGHAIHGSPEISNQNSSHGCIRVKSDAARWLNQSFMARGTKVIVYSY